MRPKIICFGLILGVFLFTQRALAQREVERKDIISVTLDAIERRLPQTASCTLEEENLPADKSPEQIKGSGFFSDFYLSSPLLDTFSFYQRLRQPILCFNEEEVFVINAEEITETITLGEDIDFDDLGLLDTGGERFVEFYLGAHYGYFSGHTLYEITFDGGKSELEFPLKSRSVIGARFVASLPRWRLFSENSAYVNTRDDSEDMQDTDWGTNDVLVSDTISDAYLKRLLIWDTSLGYVFWDNFDYVGNEQYEVLGLANMNIACSVLGGYRHEYFRYMIHNLYDVSRNNELTDPQPVGEYRVTYNIPYLGLKFNLSYPEADWGLSTRVCFSTIVRAKDFDDHLLRGKRAFGECTGWAAMVGTNAFWKVDDAWTLQGGIDFANIRTSGEQVQIWYRDEDPVPAGYTIGGLDDSIHSKQFYYWLRVNYNF